MYPTLTHRQVLVIFSGLMLGMLLAALDQTIVSTALPRITGDLGGLEHLSWVISAYLLASTLGMPLYGKLGDLFGRKLLFQVAIGVFLAGSFLAGLSHSMSQLIALRAVQGLGAGGLMVLAQSIIAETVSPRQRGRYQGYFGAAFGLASIAGPLIGGFITDNLSWRWVFYVNVPFGILALVVISMVVPAGDRHVSPRIDVAGVALLSASVGLLVLITTWGGVERPWGSSFMVTAMGLDLLLFGTLIAVELRAVEPIIPVHLFRLRAVSTATSVSFMVGAALFGSLAFLPLYLQSVTGASATASGLALFPMMGGVLISSITSGRLITRTGRYKIFPIIGTALATLGFALLATLSADTPRWRVSAFMLVCGLGMGFVMQVVIIAIQNAVPIADLGAATGTANFFREIGGSIGIAALGTVFTTNLTHRLGTKVSGSTLNIDAIKALPADQHRFVVHALATSVAHVFVFAVPVMVVGFVLTWLMPEVPLRHSVDVPLEADVPGAALVEVA